MEIEHEEGVVINPASYYVSQSVLLDSNRTRLVLVSTEVCIEDLFSYYGGDIIISDVLVVDQYAEEIDWVIYNYFPLLGDLNNDGVLDVVDIIVLVDIVLNDIYSIDADLNENGVVDIVDIISLVNLILYPPSDFYSERYMILVDGAIDENQLVPLGVTSNGGYLEYDNKASFPSLFDNTDIVMSYTDEFSNQLAEFQLDDLTQGYFNWLILENINTGQTYSMSNAFAPLILIEDMINVFDVYIGHNNMFNFTHSTQSGDFNLIFNFEHELNLDVDGISVSLQYALDCNPDIFWWCSDPEQYNYSINRPTTSFKFQICDADDEVHFLIQLLDGTVVDEWIESYPLGEYTYQFTPPAMITGGLQIYKYSMYVQGGEQCEDGGWMPFSTYKLFSNYPNPFN